MKVAAFALNAAAGVYLLAMTPCVGQAVGSFHRTFSVSGPVELQVTTGSGIIQVTGTPGSHVTVDGTIHQNLGWFDEGNPDVVKRLESDPPIEQTGNTIIVHSLQDFWGDNNISISYVITTPPNTALRAHAGSGAIEVTGLGGDADLSAGSGALRIGTLGGNLHASTGSGQIRFDRVSGDVRLHAGSGSIEGNEVGGRLDVSTGSGGVSVHQVGQGGEVHTASGSIHLDEVSGDLEAHASSGGVNVGGMLDNGHRWQLSAASGHVSVLLPQQTQAQVYLESSSGGFTVDHPTRGMNHWNRHSWQGEIGSGSGTPTAELHVHTASGSIRIN